MRICQKRGLKFFSLSPFDKARYQRLLEGLELSEINLTQASKYERFDSEFWLKSHLEADELVSRIEEKKPLGKLLDIFYRYPTFYGFEFSEYGIPVLKGEDIEANGLMSSKSGDHVSETISRQFPRTIVLAGDLVVSVRGLVGKVGFVGKELAGSQLSPNVIRLSPNREAILPEYLWLFLRSKFGAGYFDRFKMRTTQETILASDISNFLIPICSYNLQKKVAAFVQRAQEELIESNHQLKQSEKTILIALKLDDWLPPTPLNYVRSSGDVFAADRLDSQFFAPRVSELMEQLGRDGLTISDVAPARHERFKPNDAGTFNYIEIGGLGSDGKAVAEALLQKEAPSRATQFVRSGDIITSTVRPIRRLSALISEEQDGNVCSSGFVVLNPQKISSEVLLTYLRLPLFCELMDLHTSATMYPAISEADLLSLPIPAIDAKTQLTIQQSVQEAAARRQRASSLLEAAKRAVEIAIEDSEAAALAYLQGVV